MVKIKLAFCFGLLAAMFSYSSLTSQEIDYEKLADKINAKTAKKLQDEQGLILDFKEGSEWEPVYLKSAEVR